MLSQLTPFVAALNGTDGPVPVTLIDPTGNAGAPAIELRFREAGETAMVLGTTCGWTINWTGIVISPVPLSG